MRMGLKLLNETSMLSDHCVRVPETSRLAETVVEGEVNHGGDGSNDALSLFRRYRYRFRTGVADRH